MGLTSDGVIQIAENVLKMQQEFLDFLNQFLLEMGLRALAKTKKRTPVRTGFLRNSWQVSDVERDGNQLVIYLTNSAEYASYVEEGHQAYKWSRGEDGKRVKGDKGKYVEGYHMAKISLAEINREIPPRFKQSFAKWTQRLSL